MAVAEEHSELGEDVVEALSILSDLLGSEAGRLKIHQRLEFQHARSSQFNSKWLRLRHLVTGRINANLPPQWILK